MNLPPFPSVQSLSDVKKIPPVYLAAGAAVLGLGLYLVFRPKAAPTASSTDPFKKIGAPMIYQPMPVYRGPSTASTAPSTKNLVLLSDPGHQFTIAEVQYLLNLWGSNPKPPIDGQWSDTTTLAVRDFQARAFDPYMHLMDVTGDPFDVKTSGQLKQFANRTLLDPGHVISLEEAQAILGVPITGALDAATTAKLQSLYLGPIPSPATQSYLRSRAISLLALPI